MRQPTPRLGPPPQVGETRVAFAVGAVARRGLAAVPERRKIARIANRPAAGEQRQIEQGDSLHDRLLISDDEPKSCVAVLVRSCVAVLVGGRLLAVNVDGTNDALAALDR